ATTRGKSDLALTLAERLGGEIVNADAMQLYRGMDIGTAKTPVEQRRGIAHHQMDVLDVGQEASVAAYQREARLDPAETGRSWSAARACTSVRRSTVWRFRRLTEPSVPGWRASSLRRASTPCTRGCFAQTLLRHTRFNRRTSGASFGPSRSSSSPGDRSLPPCRPGSTSCPPSRLAWLSRGQRWIRALLLAFIRCGAQACRRRYAVWTLRA